MLTPTIANIIAMSAMLSQGVVVSNFQASPSIAANISFVLETANQTIHANSSHDAAATFPVGIGDTRESTIYSNWPDVFFFESGMNIDCDGIDYMCNTDGQNETTWGALSAYNVPYIVVPNSFVESRKIPQNALSVVICAGQMFYAILGDTNGNTPEVMGEASVLMGETCFPNANVSGAVGHDQTDVLYIVFTTEFNDVNSTYITDFNALRQLGDEKMGDLISALSSGSGTPGSGSETPGGKSSASTAQSNTLLILLVVSLLAYYYN